MREILNYYYQLNIVDNLTLWKKMVKNTKKGPKRNGPEKKLEMRKIKGLRFNPELGH